MDEYKLKKLQKLQLGMRLNGQSPPHLNHDYELLGTEATGDGCGCGRGQKHQLHEEPKIVI